jgi:hypothetical protein
MGNVKSPDKSVSTSDEPDGAAIAAKAAAVFGGLLTLAALGLFGGKTAFSVFVGAAIAVANLVTMRSIIRAMLPPPDDTPAASRPSEPAKTGIDDLEEMADREIAKEEAAETEQADEEKKTHREHVEAGKRGGAAWGLFAVFKIVLLFGGIWILLTRGWVDPMPLAAGYGALPLGIFASAVWGNLAPRRRRR